MELSHYVVKTQNEGAHVLYHTVTKKWLPTDASEETLAAHHFLEGQERSALDTALIKPGERLNLTIIPTWRCNLRCSHCSVLHLLQKKDTSRIDIPALEKFLAAYLEKYPVQKVTVLYVGGEALLEAEQCEEICHMINRLGEKHGDMQIMHTMTTNLAMELTETNLRFLSMLDGLMVSIDGNREQHNLQRHGFDERSIDCYETTVMNLRRLVKLGMRDILGVQAAVKDEFGTLEIAKEFYKTMVRIGINFDQIIFGGINPTILNPKVTNVFKESLRTASLRSLPCCKFRFLRSLQINPDNTVYDNFYVQEESKLGTIFDEMSVIEESYKKTMDGMPVFRDENCMKCPVIGFCWGGCIKGYSALGDNPSSLCNQQGLIEEVRECAADGTLIGRFPSAL